MLNSTHAGQSLPVAVHMMQFPFHFKRIRNVGARSSLNAVRLKKDGAFNTRTAIRGMFYAFGSIGSLAMFFLTS